MKPIVFFIASLFLFICQQVKSQGKLKEGKAIFEISFPDAEDMDGQVLAMMPKNMTVYFKDGKSRGEMKTMFGSTVALSDDKTKETIVCMDMMGKKTALKFSADEMEKEKADYGDYEVKSTGDTKIIAGYKCKKAAINYKKDNNIIDVWFTDEIAPANSAHNSWKGIDGFMMEFTAEQKGMTGNMKMKMNCSKVERMTVSDDLLRIPEGYTLMTQDEMMKQLNQR